MTTPSRMKKYHGIDDEESISLNEHVNEEVPESIQANKVENVQEKLSRSVRYNRFLNWSIFIMICLIIIMFIIVFYF